MAGNRGQQERGVIVLAGEDSNDCRIVAEVVKQHHADLGNARLVEISDKTRLKTATGPELAARIRTIIGKAKGRALRAKGPLVGLVIHEDLDGYTDATYSRIRANVAGALARESPCNSALALAAWESEAWLLLFPDAFPAVRPNWKVPAQLRGRDTGSIKSPKEELKRRLVSAAFRESDGPKVAEQARSLGLLASGPTGTNLSYTDFVHELGQWSAASAPSPRRR
ncbi:hypothetical protein [Streptomyces sp. NBC_00576]|uniref:hypothetical protein n=1 Tax=Streptomyces sp. NBC_00576 TaxID=2903665 RepID=UPI002E823D2F|nr:hypothetical protein [Streptomyces sp. NBC_00576]WUB74921.1 hypothetical protein OG734_35420 [Streptomyces sp. NBC_00576]